jgi:hypothetical protein
MGKLKQAMLNGYAYTPDYDYGYDRQLVADASKGLKALRNDRQHWHENMPDLTGQALADARDAFDEADNMPLWIQLELDLWEGQHGINEQTYWDVAGRGSCE